MGNMDIQEYHHKGDLIAMILPVEYQATETQFLSHEDFPLQIGYVVRPKDGTIEAHIHRSRVNKRIDSIQEVLLVRHGKLIVDLFGNDQTYFASAEAKQGDILYLCSGGHGFRMQEDTVLFEIKQGPYAGKQNDKMPLKKTSLEMVEPRRGFSAAKQVVNR